MTVTTACTMLRAMSENKPNGVVPLEMEPWDGKVAEPYGSHQGHRKMVKALEEARVGLGLLGIEETREALLEIHKGDSKEAARKYVKLLHDLANGVNPSHYPNRLIKASEQLAALKILGEWIGAEKMRDAYLPKRVEHVHTFQATLSAVAADEEEATKEQEARTGCCARCQRPL